MKIFLDTANIESIQKWAQTGLIDGVTTNPTHLSKEGNNPTEQVLTICDLLPSGVISVEVTETLPENVYLQARKIATLSNNIAVKIPCHADYYSVIKKLIGEGITLNIMTLGGLAIAVGRVVDDAIVVLENIFRHVQEGDDQQRDGDDDAQPLRRLA